MDGWLKGLVAVTCVAVLAAIGWWGWSEWQDRRAQEVAAQEAIEAASEYRRQMRVQECLDDLIVWQNGDRNDIREKYGTAQAGTAMEACKDTLRAAGY